MSQKSIWTALTAGGGILALLLGIVLVVGISSGAFSQETFAKKANAATTEQTQSGSIEAQSMDNLMSGQEMSGQEAMSSDGVDNTPQSGNEVNEDITIIDEIANCDCGPAFEYHNVTDRDTLSSISEEYGVSVDKIAEFNDIWNVNLIYTGSTLRIPMLQN